MSRKKQPKLPLGSSGGARPDFDHPFEGDPFEGDEQLKNLCKKLEMDIFKLEEKITELEEQIAINNALARLDEDE